MQRIRSMRRIKETINTHEHHQLRSSSDAYLTEQYHTHRDRGGRHSRLRTPQTLWLLLGATCGYGLCPGSQLMLSVSWPDHTAQKDGGVTLELREEQCTRGTTS